MNAVTLYSSTCRYILKADHENPETWADLYRLFPYLRQALSCCVCGNLLREPWGPLDSICQHNVCKQCIGGKMRLKPSCSWCKDYDHYAENKQLGIVLACYKQLCEYVAATPIAQKVSGGSNGGTNNTIMILQEGMAINDARLKNSESSNFDLLNFLKQSTSKTSETKLSSEVNHVSTGLQGDAKNLRTGSIHPNLNTDGTSSTDAHQNGTDYAFIGKKKQSLKKRSVKRLKGKKKHKDKHSNKRYDSKSRRKRHRHSYSDDDGIHRKGSKSSKGRPKRLKNSGYHAKLLKEGKNLPDVTNCRCGTTLASPGTRTCQSSRCPCFLLKKNCEACRCKGCRNPFHDGTKDENLPGVSLGDTKKELISDSDTEIDVLEG